MALPVDDRNEQFRNVWRVAHETRHRLTLHHPVATLQCHFWNTHEPAGPRSSPDSVSVPE